MKTTTLRMPDEIDHRLRLYAQSHRVSLNAAAIELLSAGLDTSLPQGPSFSFNSGQRRTLEDHEQALNEGFGEL